MKYLIGLFSLTFFFISCDDLTTQSETVVVTNIFNVTNSYNLTNIFTISNNVTNIFNVSNSYSLTNNFTISNNITNIFIFTNIYNLTNIFTVSNNANVQLITNIDYTDLTSNYFSNAVEGYWYYAISNELFTPNKPFCISRIYRAINTNDSNILLNGNSVAAIYTNTENLKEILKIYDYSNVLFFRDDKYTTLFKYYGHLIVFDIMYGEYVSY